MELGQAAVLLGVVEQGVIFPKDATHFRCMHHATSQSSLPSWLHTFTSAGLSGRCCSPGTASYLADSQGLTGYLVDPEGLPISMDPASIPSYSFHGAHMDITTSNVDLSVYALRAILHRCLLGGPQRRTALQKQTAHDRCHRSCGATRARRRMPKNISMSLSPPSTRASSRIVQ